MAVLRRGRAEHQVLVTRPDQPIQRGRLGDRLALEDRQLRSATRVQLPSDSPHGWWRVVRHGGLSARCGCDRCCNGGNAVGVSNGRGPTRRECAQEELGPRRRPLDRRCGRANLPDHAGLSHGRTRRQDRTARIRVWTRWRGRSQDGVGPVHRSREGAHRVQLAAYHRKRRSGCRCGLTAGWGASHQGNAPGPRERFRRTHRRAAVDLPHDSSAGRVWKRDVGK